MKTPEKKQPTTPVKRQAIQDGSRRTKLKPVDKEKYKPKQALLYDDDEDTDDFDLFSYLEEEDEDYDEAYDDEEED